MFTNAPMPMAAPPPPTATTTSVLDGWGAMYYKMIEQQEMQGLQQWFQMVDRDRSGTVEAEELSGLTFDGRPLGLPTAARLIRVFDKDRYAARSLLRKCAACADMFLSETENSTLWNIALCISLYK
jgi:hypothetical protein